MLLVADVEEKESRSTDRTARRGCLHMRDARKILHELYESGAYTIVDKSTNDQRFTVVHVNELGTEEPRKYEVILTGLEVINCSCGLYEHAGLLC